MFESIVTQREHMRLSINAARALMLAAQGLAHPPTHQATKADVLAAIRRMHVLQIDTIHVVARSPYLVLWSRVGSYTPRWLDDLLAEGALFEYWVHEACFVPIEDFGLYRLDMLAAMQTGLKYARDWATEDPEAYERVLTRIREKGEVRSSDFERTDGSSGTWWGWKTEKRILESMFASGELMVLRRQNFQRVYAPRERVLPSWNDDHLPTPEQVRRTKALQAVQALGVVLARWVPDYFRVRKPETVKIVQQLASEGELLEAQIEGFDEPAYIHPELRELAEAAADGALQPTHTTLLSPFDPLVWDRTRALELFGFEYRIECYTPAPKRRYGYFSLPILRRGELVGRLDAKAHRQEGRFEVKALHLEPGVPLSEGLLADLAATLRDCAAWHGTPTVDIRMSDPAEFGPLLQRTIDRA
jgi:uncharacterized protein YcaQ